MMPMVICIRVEECLPLEVAREAVQSPAIHIVTNLRALVDTLAMYDASEVKQGIWPRPLRSEGVLDLRFYDAALQKHPELEVEGGR